MDQWRSIFNRGDSAARLWWDPFGLVWCPIFVDSAGHNPVVLALHALGQDAGGKIQGGRDHRYGKPLEVFPDVVKIENLPSRLNDDITKTGPEKGHLERLAVKVSHVLGLELHPFLPHKPGGPRVDRRRGDKQYSPRF